MLKVPEKHELYLLLMRSGKHILPISIIHFLCATVKALLTNIKEDEAKGN